MVYDFPKTKLHPFKYFETSTVSSDVGDVCITSAKWRNSDVYYIYDITFIIYNVSRKNIAQWNNAFKLVIIFVMNWFFLHGNLLAREACYLCENICGNVSIYLGSNDQFTLDVNGTVSLYVKIMLNYYQLKKFNIRFVNIIIINYKRWYSWYFNWIIMTWKSKIQDI